MVEFIGFIISLLAFFYLVFKQNRPNHRQTPLPSRPNEELEEEDHFQEFLMSVEKKAEAREVIQHLPPPRPKLVEQPKKSPPLLLKDYHLKSQIEQRRLKSALEDRSIKSRFNHYEALPGRTPALTASPHCVEEERTIGPSRVQLALRRLASRRDLIIYQEIIDKPKSMRP